MRAGALLLAALLAVAACGKVGPLTLPPEENDASEAPS
jgi:predicted small lipoprotein YifL